LVDALVRPMVIGMAHVLVALVRAEGTDCRSADVVGQLSQYIFGEA
jgi:hypothetical protein